MSEPDADGAARRQHGGAGVAWVEAWSREQGADRARRAFVEVYDVEPDGVWSAPGRVNIIGEHTDYNGGLCLPIALPHRTYVALRRRRATTGDGGAGDAAVGDGPVPGPETVRLSSAQEPQAGVVHLDLPDVAPGTVQGWAGYAVGVAWALRDAGHRVHGFDAVVDSCVPYGAGLSSSAALECAVAVALDDVEHLGLADDDAGRTVLARVCVTAENRIAGAPTGGMDQSASLRCRPGHALLLDCRDGATRHIPFDLEARGLALLVIDTRAEHQLVDGQYAARRTTCEDAARTLGVATLREVDDLDGALDALRAGPDGPASVRRVRHVVTEIDRVRRVVDLLDTGQVEQVADVLTAAHASLRDDYEVSCRELDLAVATAVGAGALGGRMVGGGFGGSAVALVPTGDVARVAAAVADAFADAVLRAPAFLVATAQAAAARDARTA